LMCLLIISTKTRPVQRHQNDIIIIVQSSAVGPNVWHRLWLSNHWESLHRHQVIIRSLGPSAPILLKVPSSGFRSKTTRESLFCQVQGQLRNDIWLWHGLGVMEVLWLKNDCDQCLRVFNTKTHMNIPCLLYVSQSSIIRFGELIVELIILSHGNTIPFGFKSLVPWCKSAPEIEQWNANTGSKTQIITSNLMIWICKNVQYCTFEPWPCEGSLKWATPNLIGLPVKSRQ
jgi:hypothetical protein